MKEKAMNVTASIKHTLTSHPLVLMALASLALSALAPAMGAVESNETNAAIGRMPVLSPLTLPNGSIATDAAATGATEPVSDHAKVGVPLTLADMGIDFSEHLVAHFTDADADIEGGSFYEWLIDGVVVGTAATFTPAIEHGGQLLSVRVTPKTQTGDPKTGKAVTSNAIVVRSAIVDRFSKPDTTLRNWSTANTFCNNKGGGYRLPTRTELLQLYQEMTIETATGASFQICGRYGWPIGSKCQGTYIHYWGSEPDGTDNYWTVSMSTGLFHSYPYATKYHVTCIR